MKTDGTLSFTRLYLILPVIEGGAILTFVGWISYNRHLIDNFRSRPSIPVLLIFLAALLAFGWLSYYSWRRPQLAEKWINRVVVAISPAPVYWSLITLLSLVSAIGIYLLPLSLQVFDRIIIFSVYHLIAPFLLWTVLLAIQTLIELRLLMHGTSLKGLRLYRSLFRTCGITTGILLLIVIGINLTVQPDTVGWGIPGVPLLQSQVFLALIIAVVIFAMGELVVLLFQWRHPLTVIKRPGVLVDILLFMLLWLGAIWQWEAQPQRTSWFNPQPVPPNEEYYPYSDSVTYDLSAQRLLLGSGFESDVIRPVYSGFLALAQGVSGIRYKSVADWQVIVLAVIPPLLYLLTKMLHHRLSGILVALLLIIHESNSLKLSGIIDVSNSKMYLSDMPAQLGVILFCLFVVAWLKAPNSRKLHPLIAGGILGIFILVRTQLILLTPILPLLAWLTYRKQPTRWIKGSLIFVCGLMISLAPWIIRSFITTQSFLSDPEPGGVIFRFATFAPEGAVRLPDEPDETYIARAKKAIIDSMLAQPLTLASVVGAHYVNNHLATFFTLPTSFPIPQVEPDSQYILEVKPDSRFYPWNGLVWLPFIDKCCSLTSYVRSSPYWTYTWRYVFPENLWFPIITTLILISLGIAAGWEHTRVAVLAPVLIALFYNIGNAVARLSGWRFNLPVEWVGMMFYTIGTVQILLFIGVLFGNRVLPKDWKVASKFPTEAQIENNPFPWRQAVIAGSLFFLFTAMLPISERLIPNRYNGIEIESTLVSLQKSGVLAEAGLEIDSIKHMLLEKDAVAYIGRALYPRHYLAYRGDESMNHPAFNKRNYARLGFILAPNDENVIVPLQKSPERFPNAADVLVVGCQREDHVEAQFVVILTQPAEVIKRSKPGQWSCATP